MQKFFYLAIVAASATIVSCSKQATEEKAENLGSASQEITAIRLAMDLAQYGYEAESAPALIEAADILVATPATEMENPQIERVGAVGGEEKAEKEAITPEKLLKDAKEWAAGNAALEELIAGVESKMSIETAGTRGRRDGALTHKDRVLSQSTDIYSFIFREGEKAEVAVIGDGDTDLDLYVYDENGNLIASDTDYTDNCYVSFRPRWTGKFSIRIKNRGNVYNQYVLLTN